ncbi:hypothetical protein ACFL21_01430 [Patescibacteria group bacterium]
MIEKTIQNIGRFKYLLTIIFGKNRQVSEIVMKDSKEFVNDDFVITIGKKAVILTNLENGRRVPIIVKRWKQIKAKSEDLAKVFNEPKENSFKTYIDSEGFKWEHNYNVMGGEWLTAYDDNNNELFDIIIK